MKKGASLGWQKGATYGDFFHKPMVRIPIKQPLSGGNSNICIFYPDP